MTNLVNIIPYIIYSWRGCQTAVFWRIFDLHITNINTVDTYYYKYNDPRCSGVCAADYNDWFLITGAN